MQQKEWQTEDGLIQDAGVCLTEETMPEMHGTTYIGNEVAGGPAPFGNISIGAFAGNVHDMRRMQPAVRVREQHLNQNGFYKKAECLGIK